MRSKVFRFAAVLAWCAAAVCPMFGQEKEKEKSGAAAVVAVFSLDHPIVETPTGEDFSLFGPSGAESLKDLIARMKKARDDKDVKAVVLVAGHAGLSLAQIEEIRQAIDEVKRAGKEVHVYAETLSTSDYALACGASKLSVVPTGDLWITGLYGEAPYVRGLLDMIGVKPDFLTCGSYKSAAEMFMRTGPSPEAERMRSWLLDSLYETCVTLIASGRRVPSEKVRQWIDNGPYTAEKAQQQGLIDAVQHQHDFLSGLKAKYGAQVKLDRKYGKKKGAEMDLSSPLGLLKLWAELMQGPKKRGAGKTAVAIVYVEGPIVTGKAEPDPFSGGDRIAYSTTIRKALDDVAADDSVKAVVMRVHSPGGSALASEIILQASKRVKAKKPLVVSMGGVAGSGGYYVACGTDTIFADAATITGSIGVVGGKFATTEMWKKVGITWKSAKRGANADMLGSEDVFTPPQREKLQSWMNDIYTVFKGHVVAIRGARLKKPIDELAGGRVYTGRQALELGLVDRIGGLDDAVQFAAQQAKVAEYEVRVVPRPKSFVEMLVEELGDRGSDGGDSLSISAGPSATKPALSLFDAALPYLGALEPHRLQAVKMSLRRLDMLQREGAALMMPEMCIRN